MKINSHKDLKVWQESMNLVVSVYQIVKLFPADEKFGLISQIKRCAVSIPSNIAEGSGRKGEKELIRFLYISLGSLSELETQLEISKRLDFIEENIEINKQIIFIRIMLSNLIKSLEEKLKTN